MFCLRGLHLISLICVLLSHKAEVSTRFYFTPPSVDLNVINDTKCNKVLTVTTFVLNVITFCPKYNKLLRVAVRENRAKC